jgi:hypothetical protein
MTEEYTVFSSAIDDAGYAHSFESTVMAESVSQARTLVLRDVRSSYPEDAGWQGHQIIYIRLAKKG